MRKPITITGLKRGGWQQVKCVRFVFYTHPLLPGVHYDLKEARKMDALGLNNSGRVLWKPRKRKRAKNHLKMKMERSK